MQKIYNSALLVPIFLIIFGLQNVRAQNINHWETVVMAGDTWNYYLGSTAPPSNWASNNFDASSWLSGPGGIGYGNGSHGTVITNTPSVFIRKTFNLADTSFIYWGILHIDFEDAFVAYLNGHEIARANIGSVGTSPAFNQYAASCDYTAKLPSGGVPARFILNKDSLRKYIIQGDNLLAIEVHSCNNASPNLSSSAFFSVGIKDANTHYRSVPAWFNNPTLETSNLPLLVIDTWGKEIIDDPKIKAYMKVIDNGTNHILQDGKNYSGYIGIEVRGQSSQMFPKKSFAVETWDKNGASNPVSLLGMSTDEDWVLYAPYTDKSMLRNVLTYQLGSKLGSWQPRFKFVELYLNGNYHGIYVLIEKIKKGTQRVDINKLKPTEISGDDLTGGYIVKVDKTQDLTVSEYFNTHPTNSYKNARNYSFTYVYPKFDEIVSEQKTYISNYLTELENALNGTSFKDLSTGYRKYMDINSFVDFQLMQELANNVDGYRYSTYFYKKKDGDGGKLFAGPLWDFDLCYGNVNYAPDRLATNKWLYPTYGPGEYNCMHWWARLFDDTGYRDSLVNRWHELRRGPFKTDSVTGFIDKTIQLLGGEVAKNYQKWPILGQYIWPNSFIGNTYAEETNYLKTWITNRLTWMDSNIDLLSGIEDIQPGIPRVGVYPNPVSDKANLSIDLKTKETTYIEIYDVTGRKVFTTDYSPTNIGNQYIELTLPKLLPGYYILSIKQNKQIVGMQKIMVQ